MFDRFKEVGKVAVGLVDEAEQIKKEEQDQNNKEEEKKEWKVKKRTKKEIICF